MAREGRDAARSTKCGLQSMGAEEMAHGCSDAAAGMTLIGSRSFICNAVVLRYAVLVDTEFVTRRQNGQSPIDIRAQRRPAAKAEW